MRKIFCITAWFLFLQYNLNAQTQNVKIANSEIKKISSSIVAGQEYELQIMLPAGYFSSNEKYPVVYLMDSQWDFPLVTALYGEQYYDGFIPAMIIVGVTWGGAHPNPDSLRARDYTPTKENRLPQSGGADKFLSVIKNEVFPFVETNYKADKNNRTLMGSSLGGLFTLYTLFNEPQLFQRYVAVSPAIGWGNSIVDQYEAKYFENNSNPSARLFMCVGGVERSVPEFEKFAKHLSDRNYKSLQAKTMILENTGHSGTKAEGYARGLQYVFGRPSVSLPVEILNEYNGTYKSGDGASAEIKTVDGHLVIYFNTNNKYQLYAADENNFYSIAEFLNIHFDKDENKNITGFRLKRYGGENFMKKIK